MRLFSWSNTLYACALQDPARILYLCNTASPLDATTSIPTHLSQRMDKTTTICPVSWRGFFQIALAVAAFFMVDPYIRKLLSFVQEHCIAELSPKWFGAFVCLLVVCCCYILPRRYKRTYIPVQLRWGLLLLAAAYLYYRLSPEFYFWRIPLGDWKLIPIAWTDLLLLPIAFCLLRARKKQDISVPMQEVAPEQMGVQPIEMDRAIELDAEDRLDFRGMIKGLFADLSSLDLEEESLTMGIVAQWGQGKSSFINLLMKKAGDHGDVVVRFNPRASKSVHHIQDDFFDLFATGLSKYYMGFGFLLGRYTKHLGLLGQYEWTRPLESLLTLLLPEKNVEAINEAIASIEKRVYVAIDDLDRLTGGEIIEVLKLIDRNASFHNVVFVMAYDKAYINNVLRQYLDHDLDHSFIDKYVTWEVMLPDQRAYLKDFMLLSLKSRLPEEFPSIQKSWRVYDVDLIVEHLGSIRHLKRYVNLLVLQYKGIQGRVNPMDFLLLSLLRYKYIAVYHRLLEVEGWLVLAGANSDGDPFYLMDLNRVTRDFEVNGWDGKAQEILCRLFGSLSDFSRIDPNFLLPNAIAFAYAFPDYFIYIDRQEEGNSLRQELKYEGAVHDE